MHEITEQFIEAAEAGDAAEVERLLASGAEINDRDCVGCNALFEAASSGHVALVQWLLSHGADPNIPENNGSRR